MTEDQGEVQIIGQTGPMVGGWGFELELRLTFPAAKPEILQFSSGKTIYPSEREAACAMNIAASLAQFTVKDVFEANGIRTGDTITSNELPATTNTIQAKLDEILGRGSSA